MLGWGICSFPDIPNVCRTRWWQRHAGALHQPPPKDYGLAEGSRCPAGVQIPALPSTGFIQFRSTQVSFIIGFFHFCALFLAIKTITELLSLIHWRSCFQSCRRQKWLWPIHFRGISAALEQSAQTTPVCCVGIRGPALQKNGGLPYHDCRMNSSDTTKGS